jgi:BsuBI/PstI restriction endonuclease domain/BsuBI/PstI restriction endonuclease HTH domain
MDLPSRALCQRRLDLIFPDTIPQRGRLTNQLAASAVFVCLYVGAVDGARKLRPSMVLWMCDAAAALDGDDERDLWYAAALRGKRDLAALLRDWGITHSPWYADNTREPLRDETFRMWSRLGAIVRDESVSTTSSKPQWSLAADFAALFDADSSDDELAERIDDWREDHLGPVGRARALLARQLLGAREEVVVSLPGGLTRTLAPGGSSLILKGVIELLAPRLLEQPAVLLISESRQHVDVIDASLLDRLGIAADTARLLPDALLFDAGPGNFWFVEAVFTDGAIDEGRRAALAAWAESQGIPARRCRYVTAFIGRTAPPFRRLVDSLAWGSYAWFLDEPDRILRLDPLPARE